jgi:hypothetical protein
MQVRLVADPGASTISEVRTGLAELGAQLPDEFSDEDLDRLRQATDELLDRLAFDPAMLVQFVEDPIAVVRAAALNVPSDRFVSQGRQAPPQGIRFDVSSVEYDNAVRTLIEAVFDVARREPMTARLLLSDPAFVVVREGAGQPPAVLAGALSQLLASAGTTPADELDTSSSMEAFLSALDRAIQAAATESELGGNGGEEG